MTHGTRNIVTTSIFFLYQQTNLFSLKYKTWRCLLLSQC